MVQVDSINVLLIPTQFLEYWQIHIWVNSFLSLFQGKESYSRTKPFDSFAYTIQIVKQVLYRYKKLDCSTRLQNYEFHLLSLDTFNTHLHI